MGSGQSEGYLSTREKERSQLVSAGEEKRRKNKVMRVRLTHGDGHDATEAQRCTGGHGGGRWRKGQGEEKKGDRDGRGTELMAVVVVEAGDGTA